MRDIGHSSWIIGGGMLLLSFVSVAAQPTPSIEEVAAYLHRILPAFSSGLVQGISVNNCTMKIDSSNGGDKLLLGNLDVQRIRIDTSTADLVIWRIILPTENNNFPFAQSTSHILNFKLPIEINTQPQPVQDGFLHP